MSFAKIVKEELVTIPPTLEEQLAECAAFLNLITEFHIESKQKMFDFRTNNPTVAKRFLQLVKSLYRADTELITQKQVKLKTRQTIIIRVTSKVEEIINEHEYFENSIESQELLTNTDEAKRAFLRGAFLATGSVNNPNKAEYHLEIYASNAAQAIFVQRIMNHFDLNARIIERRKGYIAYIKEAQAISDFLQLVGAQNAVFKYEDIRIRRDLNNSINRVINCEIANEKKTVVAANQQLKDIALIEKYHIKVSEKVQRVISLRKEYQDANLRELAEVYEEKYHEPISRSGLNHRLEKISQLAQSTKGKKP